MEHRAPTTARLSTYGAASLLGLMLTACSSGSLPQQTVNAAQEPSAVQEASAELSAAALTGCAATDLKAGSYRLISRNSGKALDIENAGLQNGAKAVQFTYGGRENQRWELTPVSGGFYKLIARHSGKVLDVSTKSQDNGAEVHQWTDLNADNQLWCPSATDGGFYKLIAKHSGKALDVSGASKDNGAAVQQWNYAGGDNQQWKIVALGGTGTTPTPPSGCTLTKPTPGIPGNFSLFTVTSKSVPRSAFCSVAKWYSESAGTQIFRLFTGDDFAKNVPGGRSHARTEAQYPSFRPGAWHTFEARMKPSRKGERTYTIAQIFAGCCGPQLRIEVRSNGRINMGSRSNVNVRISDDLDYANNDRTFKLKLRTNGDQFEVYFNGSRKYSGRMEEAVKGTPNVLYHFRYGVYYSHPEANMSNTVTELKID